MKILSSLLLVLFILVKSFGQEKRPNILFILTDDQRFDALGYVGNPYSKTPEMDKLARQGTFFRNAMASTPICAASRASILSGMQERAHRYDFQTGELEKNYQNESYPVLLKKHGYKTAFFGKLGVQASDIEASFDVIENYDRNGQYRDYRGYYYKTLKGDTVHLTRYTGQKALEYLDQMSTDSPFCLSLSFSAPHAHDGAPLQYFWEEQENDMLSNTTIKPAELSEDAYFNALPQAVKDGFNRLRWTWRYDTPEKYQHSVKGYHRMIAGIDREIAAIRKKLEEKGLADNTILVLMGDNGYFLGERQLAGKWLLYDNSIRVPLVIFDPRNPKHQDNNSLVLNTDVPATMAHWAGVEIPAQWQGKSLADVVSGKADKVRDTVLVEHLWAFKNIPPSEGIRTEKWKYFRYIDNLSLEELYDLEKDPKEVNNLAKNANYQGILKEMRAKTMAMAVNLQGNYSKAPTGLHVEYIRDPEQVKICDTKPELGWRVPESAISQKAYQVLLASSMENAENNLGDIWDSGQTRSTSNFNVEIPIELMAKKTYFWKVRIWDSENRTSEYSSIQKFTTDTCKASELTANKFLVEKQKPAFLKETSAGSFFADFGKDAFAAFQFTVTAKRAQEIVIQLGEKLLEGKIDTVKQGHIRSVSMPFTLKKGTHTYLLPLVPDKRNTGPAAVALPDSFPVLMPFRYAQLIGLKKGTEIKELTRLAYFNYWEEKSSSFTSSDTILNQVFDLSKYTIKATTFAGIYVDGDRERIPYEADAYLNQLSHYTTDAEYAIARRTIDYFMHNPTWPTEWQQHMALMFEADYAYTGNLELVREHYKELKYKTLMDLVDERGLISTQSPANNSEFITKLGFKDPNARLRDIIDWPPAQKDTGWKLATEEGERDGYVFMPYNTVINAFYFKNMEIMARFAQLLGKEEDARMFRLKAEQARTAIFTYLFDEKRGVFVDGEGTEHASLHANMVPLAFGLVPEKHKASVVKFIESRGMACSVYGSQYLLDGLFENGGEAYGLELLRKTDDRSWYNMIRAGSTVALEAWDIKYKPNLDWNHAWGATPANLIPRQLWGIKPLEAGGNIIRISPRLGDLKSTSIEVPFLSGIVEASYQRKSPTLSNYSIKIPANMFAEFSPVISADAVLVINGESVSTKFGNVRLGPGKHTISVKINTF